MKVYKKMLVSLMNALQQKHLPEIVVKSFLAILKAISYLAGANPIKRIKK
ncbi:hypothetical protein [Planococcus maritimus]|nr:hypothetical protein [Planococcus maritimus]